MKWKRLISTLMAGCMLFANTAVTITADAANYARACTSQTDYDKFELISTLQKSIKFTLK